MTQKSPYIPDRPHDISTPDGDVFGHGDYADALVKTLTEAPTPFTVGMFGEWGVGKSTILGAVKAKLKEQKVAFAFFDAWRYEGDALRRQFLRDVARQLDEEEQLSGFDVEKELRDLDVEFKSPEDMGLSLSMPELKRAGITLLFGLVLIFVLLRIPRTGAFFTGAKAPNDALLAFVAALFVAVVTTVIQPLKVEQRVLTTRRIEEPDQFTEKFEHLMSAVKATRVVIAIDNLDRCSPEHAVEVLSTIKTYLEPSLEREKSRRFLARLFKKEPKEAVFLIAADRDALRRHLLGQERKRSDGVDDADAAQYVEEYLRKFFSASVPIRALLDDDVRRFIENSLSDVAEAHGAQDDLLTLAQMCAAGLRGNPRRVKQFANNLELRLNLLASREQPKADGKKQIDPPISGEVLMVAKVLMIEEEWPTSFAELLARPRLLADWEVQAREASSDDEANVPDGVRGEDWERLAAFLRAASGVQAKNLRAFLYLKQTKAEVELPGYEDFRAAVTSGDREEVERLVTEGEKTPTEYAKRLPKLLRDEAHEQYYEGARAVIDAAVSVPAFAGLPAAGEVINLAYETPQLRRQLVELDPTAVLTVATEQLSHARQGEIQKVFAEELARTLHGGGQSDRTTELARGLASVANLAESAVTELKGVIGEYPAKWSDLAVLLGGHPELITDPVLGEAIRVMTSAVPDSLPPDEISAEPDALKVVERATQHGLVPPDRGDYLVTYLQGQITPAVWQNAEHLVARLDAERGFLDLFPSPEENHAAVRPTDEALETLRVHLRAFGTPPDDDGARIALLQFRHAIWRLLNDEPKRSELADDAAAEFLNHHPGNALETIRTRPNELRFEDQLRSRVRQLAVENPQLAQPAANALVTAFPDEAPGLLRSIIVELLPRHAPSAAEVMRAHLPELKPEAGLLAEQLASVQNAVTPQALPLLTLLAEELGEDDVQGLREMLLAEIDGLRADRLDGAIDAITAFGQHAYFRETLGVLSAALSTHLTNLAQFEAARMERPWRFLAGRWADLDAAVKRQLTDCVRAWLRETPEVVPHLEEGIRAAAAVSTDDASVFMDAILDADRNPTIGLADRTQLLHVAARIAGRKNSRAGRSLEERVSELEASENEELRTLAAQVRSEWS